MGRDCASEGLAAGPLGLSPLLPLGVAAAASLDAVAPLHLYAHNVSLKGRKTSDRTAGLKYPKDSPLICQSPS